MQQISPAEIQTILAELKKTLGYPGDIVEFGCYKGDTSVKLAEAIKGTNKDLYLYDSFSGLPAPTLSDGRTTFKPGDLPATPTDVLRRFKKANLPEPFIIQNLFERLNIVDLPDSIAFALLDGDLYSSIKSSLELITPKTPKTILIHDFNNPNLPGVRQATLEWLKLHPSYSLRASDSLAIINS